MSSEASSQAGMYCRGCRYDLRGQDTPRCPECGRTFDAADPHSFLQYPGRFHGLWISRKKKYRAVAAIFVITAWLLFMLLGPPLLDGRRRWFDPRQPHRSLVALRMITFQRMLWQQGDPRIADFDRAAAVLDLPPVLEPYAHQARIERRVRLGWVKRVILAYGVPTAVCALLLIPLVRGRQRWLALGVLVLCCALIPPSWKIFEIADALLPEDTSLQPSYAYLDDYVYIDGVEFASMDDDGNTTIVAYDIRSFEGDGLRIVAFANTHVRALRSDDSARPLFEAQGLEYPVAGKPMSPSQD